MKKTTRELNKNKLSASISNAVKKAGFLPKDQKVISLPDAIKLMEIAAQGMRIYFLYSEASSPKWRLEGSKIWMNDTIRPQYDVFNVKPRQKGKTDEEE